MRALKLISKLFSNRSGYCLECNMLVTDAGRHARWHTADPKTCTECGALVTDWKKHKKWHIDIRFGGLEMLEEEKQPGPEPRAVSYSPR